MNKNKESTRYYSDKHEKSICKELGATQQCNSGAGKFNKGDVVHKDASILIECKTIMQEKAAVSIKKEWLDKNKQEAFASRLSNSMLAFNFGPDTSNYYIIDSKLARYLIEALKTDALDV